MTRPDDDTDAAPLDGVLSAAVSALRAPVAASDDVVNALKHAIRTEHGDAKYQRPAPRSRWRWFTTPRAVSASPLTLLAAALTLVVGVGALTSRLSVRSSAPSASAAVTVAATRIDAVAGAQVVRFTLVAPGAQRVALVGDFNAWDPAATALKEQDGTWTVVIPVAPGRHQYGFVVDGSRWTPDSSAARSTDADFGSANSVVFVES